METIEDSVTWKFQTITDDEKNHFTKVYRLYAITTTRYRIISHLPTQFRN